MPAISPIPTKEAAKINKRLRKKKQKRVLPVKSPRNVEVKYRKNLLRLVNSLKRDVRKNIYPLLRMLQPQFTGDAYAEQLATAFDRLRLNYSAVNVEAQTLAKSFVEGTNTVNKRQFYSAVEKAVGINVQSIIQSEGLEDALVATTRENVGLIKSIPEEYFKKLETIVYNGTTQKSSASSMISQIQELNGSTTKRAKVIARDQTSKLNSALNQQRQRNLGVEEYIWRTAGDSKVRESHRTKNGKIFRWDNPPKDTGHPGNDIQCRCVPQAIITSDKKSGSI